MPHLALGIVIMLAGAIIMACGLYVRSVGVASPAEGRTMANTAVTAILLLVGLAIAIVGILVSFEPSITAPR